MRSNFNTGNTPRSSARISSFSNEIPELLQHQPIVNRHKREAAACSDIKALGERLFAKVPSPKGPGEEWVHTLLEEPPALTRYVVEIKETARPLFVRLIPELSAAALRAKLDKELALWYSLRAISASGSGTLVLSHAFYALSVSLGYSRRTVYRTLKAGAGKFWQMYNSPQFGGRKVVRNYGVERVAEYFDLHHLNCPVEIPSKQFRGLKCRRAQLYASFHKPKGSRARPISRDAIQVATGVSRRQQQRYERTACVRRTPNFAFFEQDGRLVPLFDLVSGKSRQWKVIRRLGNTYNSQALRAHRGMTGRVNALLRQRSFERDGARLPKRFFFTPRSVARAPERAGETFLLVREGKRIIRGRMEWCLVGWG